MITFLNDVFGCASFFTKERCSCILDEPISVDFISSTSEMRSANASLTPFACNPSFRSRNAYQIVYNQDLIDSLELTHEEIIAIILHEIGHIKRGFLDSDDSQEIWQNEVECDFFALRLGLGLDLYSALIKMSKSTLVYNLEERINSLVSNIDCYRPEWTCGRYDVNSRSAIYYNLIEGMSYFLEDDSADIVGKIVNLQRNTSINLMLLSEESGISIEVLVPFIKMLVEINLISITPISEEFISLYRNDVMLKRINGELIPKLNLENKEPVETSNPEILYSQRVGCITSIMLELTYRCSEKCIHCYNPGATRNNQEKNHRGDFNELSYEEYKRLIDEFYSQGLVKVCLSGGDPFSNSMVWEIIDYLYQKDIVFDVFTNGQTIVNDIPRLAKYYPRLVGISIYSGNSYDHDYITRVNGSWEKSVSVLKQLSRLAVPIDLKCCVLRTNVNSYHSVVDLARQYGATPQIEVCVADSIEGDKCVSKYLRLRPEELEIVLRDKNVPMYVGPEVINYGGEKKNLDRFACGAGRNSLCVTPNGEVIPCCAFHMRFGNIKKESVNQIIHSTSRQEWLNYKLDDYEECGTHKYCDFCNLCPGINYSEHKTPLKPGENNCYMAKVRYGVYLKMSVEGVDPIGDNNIDEVLSNLKNEYPQIRIEK